MTIQEFLQGDKFAIMAGVELLEVGNGYARARMEIRPEHLNGGGVCQGGAIFTLADLAFAAAANSHARLTRITNEAGELIATFNGTGYRKETVLPFEPLQ